MQHYDPSGAPEENYKTQRDGRILSPEPIVIKVFHLKEGINEVAASAPCFLHRLDVKPPVCIGERVPSFLYTIVPSVLSWAETPNQK
jgi:hypothetical protein